MPVERGDAVGEPAQARPAARVRAADAVVVDHDPRRAVDALDQDACAYFATLVSASATTK